MSFNTRVPPLRRPKELQVDISIGNLERALQNPKGNLNKYVNNSRIEVTFHMDENKKSFSRRSSRSLTNVHKQSLTGLLNLSRRSLKSLSTSSTSFNNNSNTTETNRTKEYFEDFKGKKQEEDEYAHDNDDEEDIHSPTTTLSSLDSHFHQFLPDVITPPIPSYSSHSCLIGTSMKTHPKPQRYSMGTKIWNRPSTLSLPEPNKLNRLSLYTQNPFSPSFGNFSFGSPSIKAPSPFSLAVATPLPSSSSTHPVSIAAPSLSSRSSSCSSFRKRIFDTDVAIHRQFNQEISASSVAMYWSNVPPKGDFIPHPSRSHSADLIGELIYLFGGSDSHTSFSNLHVFDPDILYWSNPNVSGNSPSPRRSHSSTVIDTKLFIFGGVNSGSNNNKQSLEYLNDLFIFDTIALHWTKPDVHGTIPSPRRAHSSCHYNDAIYIFGGGDGQRVLNDVYRLSVGDSTQYTWTKVNTRGDQPAPRGYHSSSLIGKEWIIYGGSNGNSLLQDIYVLDLDELKWTHLSVNQTMPRLTHTMTGLGNRLFIIGGRDSKQYFNELLIFNLNKKEWEHRTISGTAITSRGYHSTVFYDSRLFVFGGYDGNQFYNDVHILDLSIFAYLPQAHHQKPSTISN